MFSPFAPSPVRDERDRGLPFVQRPLCAPRRYGTAASRPARILERMGTTDDGLDATSRRLLDETEELKRLELEKRHTARDSDEFHDLAAKIEKAARDVFDSAVAERNEGEDESPLRDERDEQHPGDWTEGSRK
jgi:hypothetical protein